MKKILLCIPLLIFVNCISSLNAINKEQNKFYTKEQLKDEFAIKFLEYIYNNRESVFKDNEMNNVNNFVLIEYQNAVDWSYSGCLLSKDKNIGFWKEVSDSLVYDKCNLEDYIEYLDNTNDSIIEECSKRNWASGGGMLFFIKRKKGKIAIKRFQPFSIKECIKENSERR